MSNNINVNQTFREMYTTKDSNFAPITPVGLIISVYKDGSLTQDTIGVSISVDHDGMIGSHQVTIDTTGGFYISGSDYWAVVTAGTSDGTSVIGDPVARFNIGNRNTDSDIKKINGNSATAQDWGEMLETMVRDYLNGSHTINTFQLFINNTDPASLIGSSVVFNPSSSLGGGVSRNVIAYDGLTVTVDEDLPAIPVNDDLVLFFPSGNTGISGIDSDITDILFNTEFSRHSGFIFFDELATPNTGTDPRIDGTSDNPVTSLAAVITLQGLTGLPVKVKNVLSLGIATPKFEFFPWDSTARISGVPPNGSGVDLSDCIIHDIRLINNFRGNANTKTFNCIFDNISIHNGFGLCGDSYNAKFVGTNDLDTNNPLIVHEANSNSGIFDFVGGTNAALDLRGMKGNFTVVNMTAANNNLQLESTSDCVITMDASNISGIATFRGLGELTNNAGGTMLFLTDWLNLSEIGTVVNQSTIISDIAALNDISTAEVLTQINAAWDAANTLQPIPNVETGSLRDWVQLIATVCKVKKLETDTTQSLFREDQTTPYGNRTIVANPGDVTLGELN